MPSSKDTDTVVKLAERFLADDRAPLKVVGRSFDDDWLYIVVLPARDGDRAIDHVDVMTKVEKRLNQEGYDQVLFIPARPD